MSEGTPICVDFDGTCVDHAFPYVGDDVPGAVESLQSLVEQGFKIILFTVRSGHYEDAAIRWFADNEIPLYGVNINPDQVRWSSSRKAYGQFYIDDAAVGCPLTTVDGFARPCVDWPLVMTEIEARIQEGSRSLRTKQPIPATTAENSESKD